MAREKLGADGDPPDIARARRLVESAHASATDAIAELRDLARGIHPPVLDNGLPDALASLAAQSVVPVDVSADIGSRPTPAIETIAYFCAAELLANVARHSGARRAGITVGERQGRLFIGVSDDGVGGARIGGPAGGSGSAGGSGLAGLQQRVRAVDGQLNISSPDGGPTVVTVDLPLRA
jgi:signal transduction histidine kinase